MMKYNHNFARYCLIATGLVAFYPSVALADFSADFSNTRPQNAGAQEPLIVRKSAVPDAVTQDIYSNPSRTREIRSSEVSGRGYFRPTSTIVSEKVSGITNNLAKIQGDVSGLAASLSALQRNNEERSADYFANIATINTQLQSGTTPGNPRLVKRLEDAELQLESIAESIGRLNSIAVQSANTASEAGFLLEEARAAYSLSGAVEEDHIALAKTEDEITHTVTLIQRLLNTVNDDITRMSTYVSSERDNLRTLALAVSNGDFYGRSLAKRPFSSAPSYGSVAPVSYSPADGYSAPAPAAGLGGPRPLAKIKFDRPDVQYEEPVYLAVNEALKRYPNARFDLIAVNPGQGNAAQRAIESTKARRNAEKVLRALSQMGLPQDRIDLSYSEAAGAASNEVHLYVK